MKKNLRGSVSAGALALFGFGLVGCNKPEPNANAETETKAEAPIRVGWQPPWANQGQLVQVLKHTSTLDDAKAKVEFFPFTFGGPMTEAALAGKLDVILAGDQPALTLISKDPRWKIVARLVNYRSAIVVPPGSGLRRLADLRGKSLGAAFGSSTHRDTVRILKEAGIDPKSDLTLVSIDQAEHASVIARGGGSKWGSLDALATYDPTVAVGESNKQARVLHQWMSIGVIAARGDLIGASDGRLRRLLSAVRSGFVRYAKDPARFDKLYLEESKLKLPPSVYRMLAKFEPNMGARTLSGVSLAMSPAQKAEIAKNAQSALQLGILKSPVDTKTAIDDSLASGLP